MASKPTQTTPEKQTGTAPSPEPYENPNAARKGETLVEYRDRIADQGKSR